METHTQLAKMSFDEKLPSISQRECIGIFYNVFESKAARAGTRNEKGQLWKNSGGVPT